jgi:hypothetical protein
MYYDLTYLNHLYNMTHVDDSFFLYSVLLIFGNLLTQDKSFFIINNIPLVFRLKQLLGDFIKIQNIRNTILWIIIIIYSNIGDEQYIIFQDFDKLLIKSVKESRFREDFKSLFPLLYQMSMNEKFLINMMSREFAETLFSILKIYDDHIILSNAIRLLTNIFAEDDKHTEGLMDEGDIVTIENLLRRINKKYMCGLNINVLDIESGDKSIISYTIQLINNIISGPIRYVTIIYSLEIHELILNYWNVNLYEVLYFMLNTFLVGECNCILQLINTEQFFILIKRGLNSNIGDVDVTIDIINKLISFSDVGNFYTSVSTRIIQELDDEVFHKLTYYASHNNKVISDKCNVILEMLASDDN